MLEIAIIFFKYGPNNYLNLYAPPFLQIKALIGFFGFDLLSQLRQTTQIMKKLTTKNIIDQKYGWHICVFGT